MKNIIGIVLSVLFFSFSINTYAQTGPGGIGNATGTNGQPENLIWLNAPDLSSFSVGDTWPDKSGNNYDATHIDMGSGTAPTLGTLNGLNTLNFDGLASYLRILDDNAGDNRLDGMASLTILTVYNPGTTDTRALISKRLNSSNTNRSWALFHNTGFQIYGDAGAARINGTTNISGSYGFVSYVLNSSLSLYYNGDLEISSGSGLTIPDRSENITIGLFDESDTRWFDGDIAEIIVYRTGLNTAQRTILENYLSAKYNIAFTTAGNDKMTGNGTGYTFDVAGIGQETDGSHLLASSAGFYLASDGATLDNGEYILTAHNNTSNIVSTAADRPVGVEARWARDWYVEKTGTQNITLKFDFPEGISGQYPQNISNYVLLYRLGTSGNYSEVAVTPNFGEADQVAFNVTDADLTNGYYTIGTKDQANSPLEGAAGTTWYTLVTGNWDNWETWTLDPSGALPNNPNNLYPQLASDKVVIKSGKTVTMNLNNLHCASLKIDGRLDLGTTTGHTFDNISGNGRILMAADNFPSFTDYSAFVDAGQDEGTVVYYGNTSYSLNTAHTFFNMELDMAGQTLTMLKDYTINGDLTITQGTFNINDNTETVNLNLSVNGNVLVSANGLIATGSAKARHQFNFYGDFTNNGDVSFTSNNAADYGTVDPNYGIIDANFLNGSKNQNILCNGTTNFYRIEIDKGTDDTYILDIQASAVPNFNLFGFSNGDNTANSVGLLNGTFKLGSNINIPLLAEVSNYSIPATTRLWVDGATVYKNSGNAITVTGLLQVSNGILEAKIANGLTLYDNGQIKVEGGTLSTNLIKTGASGSANVGGYYQSGGTVNILWDNNLYPNYYHFSLTYPGNTFIMSGGTLHVYDANGNVSSEGGIFIASSDENINVTGGTVIAEIAGTSNPFVITSTAPFYNLILRNTFDTTTDHILDAGTNINGNSDADLVAQPLVVLNDLTIESDVMLKHNGEDITIGGNLWIDKNAQAEGVVGDFIENNAHNRGIYYSTAQVNTLKFNGSGNSSFYIGYNTSDVIQWEFYCHNLEIEKDNITNTVTISTDSEKDPTNVSAEWHNRIIHVIDTIWVRKGIIDQGRQSIRLFGEIFVYENGQMGVYDVNIPTPNTAYFMLRDGDVIVNTEKGAVFGNIKFNSTGTATFTSDLYIKRIGYYNGLYNIGTHKLKVDYLHSNASSNNYLFGVNDSKMIYSDANASDGGIEIYVPANSSGETYGIPLGTTANGTTRSTPAEIRIDTDTDDGYIQIRPVDGELKTTNLGGGNLLSYYWRVGHSGFSTLPDVRLRFRYNAVDDDANDEGNYDQGKVLDEDPYTRSEPSGWVNTTNNTIGFDPATLEKANYTAGNGGVDGRFDGSVDQYYAYTVGANYSNWDVASTWEKGSIGSGVNEVPLAGSIVHIGGRKRVWGNNIPNVPAEVIMDFDDATYGTTDQENVPRLQFNSSGPWDIGRVTGVGMISFNNNNDPVVSADWGEFANNPSNFFMYWGANQTHTNIIQPCPSLMIEGSTQTINQNIVINGNLILTGNTTCNVTQDILIKKDLYPGAWSNGFFHFPSSGSPITVTVDGNLDYTYINTTGDRDVLVDNLGNNIEHKLIIKGDIIQGSDPDYQLDLFSVQGETNVILELQGESNNNYSRTSTSVPDLYRIVMNKGVDQTNTFTFSDDATLSGATSGVGIAKALELQNGTLILDDAAININLTTGDDNFVIPAAAALEVKDGQVNAIGNSGILLDGKLLVSGGTVDMTGGDNYIQYSASGNAEIEVTGGTLQVGSQIRRGTSSTEGILTYTQSGGTVEIGESAAGVPSRGIFEILNTGSSFTHTGGSFTLVNDLRTNPTIASFYFAPASTNLSSGTAFTFGNANTTASGKDFSLYGGKAIENLTIDNTSTNNPKVTLNVLATTVDENINIAAGTALDANGLDLIINGDFVNNGTFTANGNSTYFSGAGAQQITGTSLTEFYNLYKNTNFTLSLTNDATVTNELHLTDGSFDDAGNTLNVHGDMYIDITTLSGATGDGIAANGTANQQLIGNAVLAKLKIDNPEGLTVPTGYNITINTALKMNRGIFDIGKNLLILNIGTTIEELSPFSENNMVQTNISFTDAGIKKYFPTISSSTIFTYPIGSNGKYTPLTLDITNSGTDNLPIRVKAADEIHPTIVPPDGDPANVLKYYWIIDSEGATNFSAKATMQAYSTDVQLTGSNTAADYITARLLSRSSGTWDKYGEEDYNESTYELSFDFTNTDDAGIDGDYTAGIDAAIPNQVAKYITNQVGVWTDQNIWTPTSPAGGPRGAIVIIRHEVNVPDDYVVSYETWLDNGSILKVNRTKGHRLGNVHGTGKLYMERGDMPAGDYTGFFAADSGTVEYGYAIATNGVDEFYDILSEMPQVNNIIVSGSGTRRMPNLNFHVLGDLTINGPELKNEHNQKMTAYGDIIFDAGSFTAGTGTTAIVEIAGNAAQTISGVASFTGSSAFYNFTMNNVNGLTLSRPVDIDYTLDFTNGVIFSDATNILKLTNPLTTIVVGAGAGSYVDGPVTKNISNGESFNFPVGNAGRYGNVSVSAVTSTDYWEAEYMNHNPNDDGYNPATINSVSSLKIVSSSEYWRLKWLGSGNVNAKISLRYDGQSGIPADGDMRIAQWLNLSTDAWDDLASDTPGSGYINSTNDTVFNEFTTAGSIFTLSTIYQSQLFTWEGDISAAWETGGNWNQNRIPNSLDGITIPNVANDPVISSAAECAAIDLASGATLTINAGHSLTAYGNFSNAGTLILKSPNSLGAGGSFIDNGTITGSGNIQVERYVTKGESHYISSPIQATSGNATSALFTSASAPTNSAFNANFYSYYEPEDLDGNPATAPAGVFDPDNLVPGWKFVQRNASDAAVDMSVGEGYSYYCDINGKVVFDGSPTTGTVNITGLTYTANDPISGSLPNHYDGWNLVGNPYPSAIDWDLVRGKLTNMDDAIYVWNGTQYASYVAGSTGGTGVQNNEIAPMQAFFVHATANTAGFTLNNTDRIHSTVNFKDAKVESVPENTIKLRIDANGFSDLAVIEFKSNATDEFDSRYDAYRLFTPYWISEDVPHLFSITKGEKTPLMVNALPETGMGNLHIPLGIKMINAGTCTIVKEQFNMPGVNVYLVDKLENKTIYLNEENSYTFSFAGGDIRDRFELRTQLNRAPFTEDMISNQTINEDEAFNMALSENTFIEFDEGDHIVSYTATLADGTALPTWLSFDATTKTFSGTPTNAYVGTLNVKVEVTDVPGATNSQEFTIEVQNVNDAPELTNAVADLQATEDVNFEFMFSNTTFTDIDVDDVLTYSATLSNGEDLPVWLSFNADTRTFTGLPENNDVAILEIKLTATDNSGAQVYDVFVLDVQNVNDAPELVNEIPDQSIDEGFDYSYTIPANTFNDVDLGDEIQLSARQADGSGLPQWLLFDLQNGILYGRAENPSDIEIMVTATDKAGATTSDVYTLTVKGTTGINSLSGSEVSIYPNPTSGKFVIKTDFYSDDLQIVIRDYSGKTIKTQKPSSKQTEIDISKFASGIYFIEIRDDNERAVRKINLTR